MQLPGTWNCGVFFADTYPVLLKKNRIPLLPSPKFLIKFVSIGSYYVTKMEFSNESVTPLCLPVDAYQKNNESLSDRILIATK